MFPRAGDVDGVQITGVEHFRVGGESPGDAPTRGPVRPDLFVGVRDGHHNRPASQAVIGGEMVLRDPSRPDKSYLQRSH